MEQKYPWVSSMGRPDEGSSVLPTSVVLKSVLPVKVARGSGLILGLAHVLAKCSCSLHRHNCFVCLFGLVFLSNGNPNPNEVSYSSTRLMLRVGV